MSKQIRSEYRRLRKLGFTPINSLRSAKIRCEFEDLQAAGKVALRITPDEMCYDVSFVDTWDESADEKERIKREIIDRANSLGVWGMIGEYKCSKCGCWKQADSIWGFIGEDWNDSGYDVDVMSTVLSEISGFNPRS